MSDALQEKLAAAFGLRAPDLERQVRKVGRLLPRRQRRNAARIIEAEKLTAHPKLFRQVDQAGIEGAYRDLAGWLDGVNASEARVTRLLNWLAGMVLSLIVIGVLVGLVIAWRDLV
ncbi:hypothetical protein AADZ90_019210 [Aestuariibius sp. 2305UL40-4]|uniref:hypothetical protein n=1 Tax=Aestuariibius violaceus TaxID=3234132 RepID=UPI00345F0714